MMRRSPSHDSSGNKIPSALDHVHEIAIRGRQLAVFLDYDGTLTPIVSGPEQAVLADSTRRVLRTLAAQVPVAILSGRDLDDIQRRVGIDGIVYGGSHGFDIAGPRGLRKQVATEFLSILDATEKQLGEKLVGVSGAVLERKRFSIAVHYRQADKSGPIKVEQAVNDAAARHRKLRMIAGKKVYELQPNIDWHKGKALIWLLDTLGLKQSKALSLYIGDDVTDEDAFRALRQIGIGIVVSEHPRSTAALYALKSPTEVDRFLHEISADLLASADSQSGST
jgi:trehalose-phosphatase